MHLHDGKISLILDWEWSEGSDPLTEFLVVSNWNRAEKSFSKEILNRYQKGKFSNEKLTDSKRFRTYFLISTLNLLGLTTQYFGQYAWEKEQFEELKTLLPKLIKSN